ncbi:MAG: tetratricopeptide repeat protein [Persephonella sp.]|nr:tetratricopeptide repeat protein [Persephonella sp.]
MSLIIDSLKKLKKGSTSKSIPPGLKSKDENLSVKRVFILGVIIAFLGFSFAVLKIFESRFTAAKNSYNLPVRGEDLKESSVPQKSHKRLYESITTDVKPTKTDKPQKVPEKQEESRRQQSMESIVRKYKEHKKDSITDTKKMYVLYITLANKYLKSGNYTESLKFYQKAYSIKPEERILTNIIILKIGLGSSKIEEIEKIKDTENLYKIALFAINRNRFYLVEKVVKKRLLTDSSGTLHYLLGILYEKMVSLKMQKKSMKKPSA